MMACEQHRERRESFDALRRPDILATQEPQEKPSCLRNATSAQRQALRMVAEGRKPAEILTACGDHPSISKRWVDAISSPAQRPRCWRQAIAWLIRQMRAEEVPVCNPGYRLRQLQTIVTKAMTEGEGYDPELAKVIGAWPTLPGPVEAGIVAMVKAAGLGEAPRRSGA